MKINPLNKWLFAKDWFTSFIRTTKNTRIKEDIEAKPDRKLENVIR